MATCKAEEIFNAITHGVGGFMAVIGGAVLIYQAISRDVDAFRVLGFAVYIFSLICLYLASTLYHSFRKPRVKHVFKIMDHAAIYLLIAGTYTPFLLILTDKALSVSMLGIVWSIAVVGVILKIFLVKRFRLLSTVCYLGMGWMVVFFINELMQSLPSGGFYFLLAGGLFYSLGTIFYIWQRLPFNHGVWHLFVLAGSIAHYFAIYLYVLPL